MPAKHNFPEFSLSSIPVLESDPELKQLVLIKERILATMQQVQVRILLIYWRNDFI